MSDKSSNILHEGKTKIIRRITGSRDVFIESKNTITAKDNPKLTKEFGTKAIHSTTTTCNVFDLLEQAGIPLAYKIQQSKTIFIASGCKMIPLEVIVRRYAVGSFLKRHPEMTETSPPSRFSNLVVEFFLKTTRGKLINSNGKTILTGLNPEKGEEDPLILDVSSDTWELCHSKKPSWCKSSPLGEVKAIDVCIEKPIDIQEIKRIAKKLFLVLEGAWNNLGFHFIDLKIEFGIDPNGRLVVADVIDNDSWRLKDSEWQELSKQKFRDGDDLKEVEESYEIVASLTEQFRIPKQAIIIWRGSKKDEFPLVHEMFEEYWQKGISFEDTVISGHKSTRTCLDKLEKYVSLCPDGGVIIAIVGRSNGLAPILATHTTWPIIAVPATIKDFPGDIWSSIRMPSSVPLITAWPVENAIEAALNILSQKNPAIYMQRMMKIEELDI